VASIRESWVNPDSGAASAAASKKSPKPTNNLAKAELLRCVVTKKSADQFKKDPYTHPNKRPYASDKIKIGD